MNVLTHNKSCSCRVCTAHHRDLEKVCDAHPTARDVIDRYFLEHRAKLIDLAAFLDRLDRTCLNDEKQWGLARFGDAVSLKGACPSCFGKGTVSFLNGRKQTVPNIAGCDYRIAALFRALKVLSDGKTNRAGRVLEIFSDKTTEQPQSANGAKSATGAAREEGDCR